MKRLLRGGKSSDKKSDDAHSSPSATSTKKSWAAASGISALQQSRLRSGSHPQIRHLAMEGHTGPVTKATMDEIRREAGSSSSNLKINSLSFVPTPDTAATPGRASLDARTSLVEDANDSRGYAGEVEARAPASSWGSEDSSSHFPPRTTSAVLMSPAPPPIDTTSPEIHRARGPLPSSAALEGTGSETPATAPAVMSMPALPQNSAPSADGPRRIISEKIKTLATRFSNSNLKEPADHAPSPIRRRPSNTPSVSERVSQFDNHEIANDPRSFGLFGRFGVVTGASTASGMHSRSSSINGGGSALNGFAPHYAGSSGSPTQPPSALASGPSTPAGRRPQSMIYSTGSTPVIASSSSVESASGFEGARSRSRTSRSSNPGTAEPARPATSSYVNDYELEDTDEDDGEPETVPTYRPSLRGKVALDHQSTIAAGVQLNFSRTSTQSKNAGSIGSTGYRGMRSDAPGKRRGSLRSAFNTPDDAAVSVPADPPVSYRRAGAVVPVVVTSAAASTTPTSTSSSAAVMAATTASLAELQRSISATSQKHDGLGRARSHQKHDGLGRARSQSHAPPVQQPQISGAAITPSDDVTPKRASTGDLPAENTSISSDTETLLDGLATAFQTPSKPFDDVLSTASSGSIATAASLVESLIESSGASKVLSPAEYDRCMFEAAALKQRIQAARTRLTSEIRTRDAAKSAAETNTKSSGTGVGIFNKSKHASNAQLNEDLEYASSRVQQTEADIVEHETKQRVVEAALHAHQTAVLAAAVRTLVAEAVRGRAEAQQTGELAQQAIDKAKHDQEQMQQENSQAQQRLEAQVRALQNENQGVTSESKFAQHSAGLTIERLTGELTALREQKLAAEQHAASLERRLDEALLHSQEVQQAAVAAEARASAASAEAANSRQCIRAFSEGLRSLAAPLRVLGSVHDSTEKLRALSVNDVTPTQTPPSTPTLALKSGPTPAALSVDALEALPLESCDAEHAAAAMVLLNATVSGCASLCAEAMRVGDTHSRLQRDLATEKRLREAQGLAISQQREKLARHDQEVKDATESLVEEHRKSEGLWAEERQRLLDNIERLTQDVNTLRAEPVAVVGSIEAVVPSQPSPALSSSVEESELRERIIQLEAQIAEHVRREAAYDAKLLSESSAPKEALLGDYMRKLRDASTMLTSAATTAVEGPSESGGDRLTSGIPPNALRRLSRRKSLSTLDDLRTGSSMHTATTASAFIRDTQNHESTRRASVATADAQTMTEGFASTANAALASAPVSSDDGVNQMLLAYSEKLMSKEDLLRNREDELEAIRASAAEIETVILGLLPSSKQPTYGSIGRSSLNASPPMANVAWSYGTLPQYHHNQHQQYHQPASKPNSTNGSLRNRSASFFQGLRTSYLGSADGSDVSGAPPLSIHTDTRSLSSASRSVSASVSGSPRIPERPGVINSAPTKLTAADGVPQLIRSLLPLMQMVSSEVRRLKSLVYDLEEQSRGTRVELFSTQEKLSNLQDYCSRRAKEEESVQHDITHVLGQISRLRTRVLELEAEKERYEIESDRLRSECRRIGDLTAEKVLGLIVDRIGTSEWARSKHTATDTAGDSASSQTDSESSKMPARFANVSRVAISHPEAGDIRAEFNELMHQVIARRDEDVERMKAVADAWRADARKTSRAAEAKAWNTSTRGIQTI
ncbi:hypothetical protein GGI15_001247 [Coemansia interrupta]|uniref:Up-regulated during septation protein 1 domain-containing protein n=1 Tax=Coemansia interrupta TaxID=1126814 RepID=A0A9W8HJX7_9FUNG|nr:hypothetical protein GGI15_001247 [Coemansia interrupta]